MGKKKKSEPPGAPAWMVTYSDMVTLLLTFFVLLLSMANMDPVKFLSASQSIKDSFGIHKSPLHTEFSVPIMPSAPITPFAPVTTEQTQKIYSKIKNAISAQNLSQDIDIELRNNDTIILRVKEAILFTKGQTILLPQSYSLLRFIADIVRPLPYNLRIEGHTDPQSDAPLELAKWDISMARAVSVLRFMKKSDLLPMDRMSAMGYGDSKPLTSNASEEGRAQNRRVEFILRSNKAPQERQGATPSSSRIPL